MLSALQTKYLAGCDCYIYNLRTLETEAGGLLIQSQALPQHKTLSQGGEGKANGGLALHWHPPKVSVSGYILSPVT